MALIKPEKELLYDPPIPLLAKYLKKIKAVFQRANMLVYYSSVHTTKIWNQLKYPLIDKDVYIQWSIVSHKINAVICSNVNGTERRHVKCSKPAKQTNIIGFHLHITIKN